MTYIAPMRLLSATIVAIIMTLLPSLAPPAAAAWPRDASITNVGTSKYNASLIVCKDWGKTACASSSPRYVLGFGKNSKRDGPRWADTDGYWVPAGFVSSQGYAGGKTGRWIQTHGRGGFTYSISIRRL